MEIVESLWQFKIPMRYNPLGYTLSYFLSDELTLIDTGVGTGGAREVLDKRLEDLGFKTSDIERVILTHMHRDHVGLVDYIRSESGAKVFAHIKASDVLESRVRKGKERYEEARKDLKALGGGSLLEILSKFMQTLRRGAVQTKIDETVSDGDSLRLGGLVLRVFWTPGHAPEHICLYDSKKRLLFSGDHVLPQITSHVSLHSYEDADPLSDYLNSLEKLRRVPVDLVLPAHEHEFRELGKRIDELRHHHETRCREILHSLKEGERTVFQLSERVSWDSVPWRMMPFWIKRMAATETLAHLVFLRNRGEVEESTRKGVLYYSLLA